MVRGYDNPRFNHEMVMDLQFCEGVGALTLDWSKSHMAPNTLTGAPDWTNAANDLTYLDFDGTTPDYIVTLTGDSGDLNFTTGDFSGAAWFYPHAYGERMIFNKGMGTTGWDFIIASATGEMRFRTYQAGPTVQSTRGTPLTLNIWQFVGFTRDGANARIYVDGRDDTVVFATHINPVTAPQNFYIGTNNGAVAGHLDGLLWRPRIWSRTLTAAEMLAQYEIERGLFGV